jgi:hypothetical protein
MSTSLFDKVSSQLRAQGIQPRTSAAQAWLREKITALRIPTNRSNILNDAKRVSGKTFVGRMYFYHYEPKLKDVLPVWDKFPLVIPMETYSDGFLAMNLHYLDPYNRLALLNRLYDFANNDKYDDTTRLNLSYDLLASSRRYKLFEPCIKRYLLSHIRSSIIYIEPDNWETAIFLPTEKMIYKK